MRERIGYLDGWRGLAILCVLIGHFFGEVCGVSISRMGVELFLVLSGSLMANILFVKRQALMPFYLRRLSRIYPALLVFCSLAFLASIMIPSAHMGLSQLIAALTLSYNYYSLIGARAGVVDHVWSLCVEEHLYLVLGAVAALHRWKKAPALPVLCLLATATLASGFVGSIIGGNYYTIYWRSDVRGASILMGAICFLALRQRSWPSYFSWVAFSFGLLLNLSVVPDAIKYSFGTACLALSLTALKDAPASVLKLLEMPGLRWLGVCSYSIYLWQQPFYSLTNKVDHGIVFLACALGVGYVSYRLVEDPTRSYLNRLISSRMQAGQQTLPVEASVAS